MTQGNAEILSQIEHSNPFEDCQAADISVNEEKQIHNLINQ
jgi:hypothetical protein